MSDKHISSRFDADLEHLSSRFFEMGGLVESQVTNAMEVEIEAECGNFVARRQPVASDQRRLMAFSRGITNLEHTGDEAR